MWLASLLKYKWCSTQNRYYKTRAMWTMSLFLSILVVLCFHKLIGFFQPQISDIFTEGMHYDHRNNAINNSNLLHSEPNALCVLVRIYGPQVPYLTAFALGFLHNSFDYLRMYVINTHPSTDNQLLSRTIDAINRIALRANYITLLNLGKPLDNDYGYTLTDHALTYLYNQYERYPSMCQYIIITNGDNLYSRHLGSKILPLMKAKKDIIAWDFVTRYPQPYLIELMNGGKPFNYEVSDDGTAKHMEVSLETGFVDLGAVAYRLSFLSHYRLNFSYSNRAYIPESDGLFVEMASRLTNNTVLVRQILYIHQ
ncbi:unnamed protein product [Rotaria socialis]|uniref:Uncharacterized protein n=1 Tax=Rotaria socialis TaxID=392032 RepID=A0A818FS97_9BILA|nr:unnamed protein product [Rotaria socialis]CAF4780981.1 unnamed protein product [Rotaria socialis]